MVAYAHLLPHKTRRRKSRKTVENGAAALSDAAKLAQAGKRQARRLLLVRCMLERVSGALQENTAVHGLLPQLIVPAVRSKDAVIREQGLVCLGLCCLLDKGLALDTFPLFVDQMQRGTDRVKLAAVQLVFDLIVVHGLHYLVSRNVPETAADMDKAERQAELQKAGSTLLTFLLALLEDEDERIQACAAQGFAKLMLSGTVPLDAEEVLKSIVLVYMSPETAENQELRQCLSYFLPAYCYSSPTNQRRLRNVWMETLAVLMEVFEDKDEEQEMVAPPQIAMQLIDWMDSAKAIYPGRKDGSVNADVLQDLLREIVQDNKGERKFFTQLLAKVTLPEELDEHQANALLLITNVLTNLDPFESSTLSTTFARFAATLTKRYADAAEVLDVKACLEGSAAEGEESPYAGLIAFFDKNGIDAMQLLTHVNGKSKSSANRPKPRAAGGSKGSSGKGRKQTPPSDEEEQVEEEEEEEEDAFEDFDD